jgi:hypothetical protein
MERTGTTISQLTKRKRYDPSAAKAKKFYSTSKRMKSYSAMMKRELSTSANTAYSQSHLLNDEQSEPVETKSEQKSPSYSESLPQNRHKKARVAKTEETVHTENKDSNNHSQLKDDNKIVHSEKKNLPTRVERKSREELQADWKAEEEARRKKIALDKQQRTLKRKIASERTRRGQPVIKNQIAKILSKLQSSS